jgi:thiol-disulfide isomerase/thioredoxin
MLLLSSIFVVASNGITMQTAAAQPTPQECVKSGREFATKRQNELRPLTSEIVRKIDAERIEMVRACAAPFDLDRAEGPTLTGLVELYIETQQPDLAARALDRGLATAHLPAAKADLLALGVRMLLRQPKSAERNARAEAYIDRLDALPADTLEQKLTAHTALNNYYRGDDIDAGIIKHSTWLIDNAKALGPETRKKAVYSLVGAYINLAEALAGQGDNDRALNILDQATRDLSDLDAETVTRRLAPVTARYRLVGTSAKPIEAPAWLNRANATALDLKGAVTLVQFTAHWCGPCKESYPGMQRLRQRFKDQPFQEVFYTRTYGYFESERPLTPEVEIARDRVYYAGYGFDIPIAIGPPSSKIVDGKTVFQEDPIEQAFAVGGIPQINVIDTKGNIRLIMVGYDDANEEKLATFIAKLLKEK